jgi:hypothetical protein
MLSSNYVPSTSPIAFLSFGDEICCCRIDIGVLEFKLEDGTPHETEAYC